MATKPSPLEEGPSSLSLFLCVSSILLKTRDGSEKNLAKISNNTQKSFIKNNIQRLQSSVFYKLFSCNQEFRSVMQLLRWTSKNINTIKTKEVSNLILDTLHDTHENEKSEIIYLLKNIIGLGINVITFGECNTPINVGAVDDLT